MRNHRTILMGMLAILFLVPLSAAGYVETMEVSGPITTVPNSISDYEGHPVAVFAGGCFWGVEHLFERQPGVLDAVSGYTGGWMEFPTYRYVLTGRTGHVESVAVFYDPELTSYEELAKFFFEIHDPTQLGGQGPDIGLQYESVVFYGNSLERETAERLIGTLQGLGYNVVTRIRPRTQFYRAEGYHQDYYERFGGAPYCHAYTKRFPD